MTQMGSTDTAKRITSVQIPGTPQKISWSRRIPKEFIVAAGIGGALGQAISVFVFGLPFNPFVFLSIWIAQSAWAYNNLRKELEDEQRKSI